MKVRIDLSVLVSVNPQDFGIDENKGDDTFVSLLTDRLLKLTNIDFVNTNGTGALTIHSCHDYRVGVTRIDESEQ